MALLSGSMLLSVVAFATPSSTDGNDQLDVMFIFACQNSGNLAAMEVGLQQLEGQEVVVLRSLVAEGTAVEASESQPVAY